ncbi:phosphatase PAP2 family protein [Lactobacillus nasalidis]|uniref:Phosphatase PAP2 family protein n=1 Tax=Lactobacillus nasalidis TaxID=2797258 RepID=A0ABQ3W4W5_9LACO|nr:phosphatase PAP2 family protein [Lactobacillus nasalidis]GHV97719.1 phosphatase PAP2 family protein [Lactobacillus nasalidis]GHV99023.1 phosphatase PAP2 family protein [Lactobacillus nasalidis]GHW01583.1 phosphatase PAP2 family protein [Lactobacillus nasalidis]
MNTKENKVNYQPLLLFGGAFGLFFAYWVSLIASKNPFIKTFDTAVYNAIKNNSQLEHQLTFYWTQLGNTLTITVFTVILVLVLICFRDYIHALFASLTMIAANSCNSIIKNIIQRQRPHMDKSVQANGFSFPSGHSVGSMTLALVLIALIVVLIKKKPLKTGLIAFCIFFAFSIGFTRMYLHVHWPSDVLGGWCEGLAFGLIGSWLFFKALAKQREKAESKSE